jgi:hypothetical protein
MKDESRLSRAAIATMGCSLIAVCAYIAVRNYQADSIPTSVALIDAGKAFPGAHVCESEPHPLLMALASEHAQYMARHRRQGHQRWNERSREIIAELGQVTPAEICAESWDRQAHDPLPEVATEMFRCWKTSEGHWSVASRKHRWFGCDMAQGRNGVWYACIIVAD